VRANSTTEYIKAKESFYSLPVWKFSFLDRSCLSMIIRGIWIFDSQLDIENMKEGLKELLGYYPHLSGRIKDGIGVYLTNQGIPFTVVNEPGISLHSLQKSKDSDLIKHFSTPLATSRIKRGIDPLLTVKVARLRDASVLGVQCAHACMDGRSFYTMMENWGKICRKEDFEKPLLDQSLFPGPTVLSKEEIKQLAVSSGWKSISTFSFITRVLPKFVLGTVNKRSRPFYFSKKSLGRDQKPDSPKDGPSG
jgi:hypothetical protein